MEDYETPEVEQDEIETDETDEGSFLATAAVFGVGTLVGVAAARSYGKVKETVQTRIAARRDRKIEEAKEKAIETTATEAE